MGVKGVPDAAAPLGVVGEADGCAALADGLAVGARLLGADAVLLRQVLDGVLAFGGQVWGFSSNG